MFWGDILPNTFFIFQRCFMLGWVPLLRGTLHQDFAPVPLLVGRAVLLNEVSCVDIGVINTGQRDRAIGMGDQRIAAAIIGNSD